MATMAAAYPIVVEVDAPAQQNRLSVLLRLLFAIPTIFVGAIVFFVAEIIWFIAWFAIVATGRFPEGMLRFTIGALRWYARAVGYCLLLTDKYPPFSTGNDAAYPVRMDAAEEVEGRNRITTFWPVRSLLAIPHLIIVAVLGYAVGVVAIIAWFAALFTGSVPEGLHNFMAGYIRWFTRAYGYLFNLTDKYPPFSLS